MGWGISMTVSPEGLGRSSWVLLEAAGDVRLSLGSSSLCDSFGRSLGVSPVCTPGRNLCENPSAGKHHQQCARVGTGFVSPEV